MIHGVKVTPLDEQGGVNGVISSFIAPLKRLIKSFFKADLSRVSF